MPLEFRRFAPTGPRTPRETATLCNQIGENTATQIASLEGRVDLLEALIVELRFAAQGSMYLGTPQIIDDADITATYQTIDQYDTIGMTPRGCTMNTSTGEFTMDIDGPWLLFFRINIEHNESNSGRETFLRLFNVSETTFTNPVPIAIGRNTPGSSDTPVLAFELSASEESDTFRVEIGGGDTLTNVRWQAANLVVSYQGQLGGLVDPTP